MRLRKECETCEGRGETYDEWAPLNRRICSTCHGSGGAYPPTELIDLGDGYTFTPRYVEGELLGFDHTHPRPDGSVCKPHWIPVGGGANRWDLLSLDPLTLSPSLACRACGSHGFVREGKWVPA